MPGFFVNNLGVDIELHNYFPERCVLEKISCEENIIAKRNTLNKFMFDKTFEETEESIMILEGYLLNKKELFEQYHVNSISSLMYSMYYAGDNEFFSAFRGAFSGVFYDKRKDKWLIFTNQTGEKAVFYSVRDGKFLVGSQINYILDACRVLDWELSFDDSAAYHMLTFGFMEKDETYANEIKRLEAGMYISIQNEVVQILRYHQFKRDVNRFLGKTEDEIIDSLDEEFRKAVAYEYEKDKEYELKHIADLSGGLDSRMNMWVAHESFPCHILLMTYCKANWLDELIAKEIAEYWKDELLIKPLDDLSFFYDIDEICFLNAGLSNYIGCTGNKRMLDNIDFLQYGLEHTGQIGDVVIGSFFEDINELKNRQPSGKNSEKLKCRLDESFRDSFEDYELYLILTRGFRGAICTHLIKENYTEVASPFLYIDLLQMCLDIPSEMRMGHDLYKKWIIKKYPKAAKFPWEKIRGKITEPQWRFKVKKMKRRVLDKARRVFTGKSAASKGMNPLDYWYVENPKIKSYMDGYAENAFGYISKIISEELFNDMKKLYSNGNVEEKCMVLTVLSSAKMYFKSNIGTL